MKVIGAGLPRTATTTKLVAFEQLGFAPCYHMRDLMGDIGPRNCRCGSAWPRATPTGRRSSTTPQSTCDSPRRATTASCSTTTPTPRCAQRALRRGLGAQHARDDLADVLRRLRDVPRLPGPRHVDPDWDRFIR